MELYKSTQVHGMHISGHAFSGSMGNRTKKEGLQDRGKFYVRRNTKQTKEFSALGKKKKKVVQRKFIKLQFRGGDFSHSTF